MAERRRGSRSSRAGAKHKANSIERGRPVQEIGIEFQWQTGDWMRIFDKQIELINSDVRRARADDKLVVYLSCPISPRGGGSSATNIDIAQHTERSLMDRWGERFWILNPGQYQLESKEGTGLIEQHAEDLKIPPERLEVLRDDQHKPGGGDYMRMWTKVLCEDDGPRPNTGRNIDMFYFLGPSDVLGFFSHEGSLTVTAGVEQYFARKYATDPDFCESYSKQGIRWGAKGKPGDDSQARGEWELARRSFFQFYATKASVNFSLGSHDEWNIWRLLNQRRLEVSMSDKSPNGDVGDLIPGYFDGNQIPLWHLELEVPPGYALRIADSTGRGPS